MDINREEGDKALNKMKKEKFPYPSGTTGLETLTSVFRKVLIEEVNPPVCPVSLTPLPLIKKN